jgi:hypothetical protein
MIYDIFLTKYQLTKPIAGDRPLMRDPLAKRGMEELKVGVYNNGIYTIISREEANTLLPLVESVFTGVSGNVDLFAVDWMGRIFATDAATPDENGSLVVICLDLAGPTGFYTDANFENFHNHIMVNRQESIFEMKQYREWMKSNSPPGDGVSCVGYKIPLFMGGKDEVENLELSDRSVYLHLLAQMSRAVNSPSEEDK